MKKSEIFWLIFYSVFFIINTYFYFDISHKIINYFSALSAGLCLTKIISKTVQNIINLKRIK